MAMNQIPGQNIYISGIYCMKNKAALEREGITHVVSVLRLNPAEVDKTFSSYQHFAIDADDTDDENLLQHFPDAVRFIKSAVEAGGKVLVHCAMGKSRSTAVCIAYLLHQKPNMLTPQSALEILRQCRPLCEPNDGFMEQLALYHEMGCPEDITEHPVYQRWLYRRDVEESVACGRAPEMESVRFEDEQPTQSQIQEKPPQEVEIKCRKCRKGLASSKYMIPHDEDKRNNSKARQNTECAHVFLHPMKWMSPSLFPSTDGSKTSSTYDSASGDAPLSGRLICPNPTCGSNVGKFAWQGLQCNCGSWVVPALGLAKARVDIANKVNTARPPAALGIRMPPGMRPLEPNDGSGRGNL
ncbi:hypothetical protein N7532_006080 [Penicillium argentinense]|uniref:protein-tyrosine-phosphatase n=1 Tax=Penicillium argentinense TaxID=1131581 RepID=A0A9W9FFD8_9EURO|nr:uncharacterized protein N7532_006080 [Penicillium argentinense]KAJ5099079.1 hypothetical protein N7532_006080 [Penicillium argentinense]